MKKIYFNKILSKTFKKNIFLFFFIFFQIFFSKNIFAQKKYFQQAVDYKIDVALDDKKHTLTGTEKLIYTNNSPDALNFIYFHLYQNAYSSQQSAFAKQFLRNNNTKFYFAKDAQMGSMNLSSVTINGQRLEVIPEKNKPDIVKIILNKPVAFGESITLDINFTEHFPDVFSRGGHIGQQYLATQWYPKPAVYDATGWHLIPYLDQGEFYGEFGKFDVSLTLPENYVVGATGTLQTESEKAFIADKIVQTKKFIKDTSHRISTSADTFPTSSQKLKTIRFTADSIHDFAWFADKRFLVLRDEAILKTGKKIPTFVYFRSVDVSLWKDAARYAARAVEYYSERVGDYPYAHASAVMQQSNGVGGGMEYPMITLIGDMPTAKDLDETITHEVGHNWFYGILGSNERDNGWMDEGFNTYFETGYAERYYPKDTSKKIKQNFLSKGSDYSQFEIMMQKQMFLRRDQAPSTTSDSLTELNYGLDVYAKTAISMRILEKYLGVEKFDKMMHNYYSAWQFKHPQPADVRQVFETEIGENLSWFFDGLISSTKQVDYKITGAKKIGDKYLIVVKNKTGLDVPFEICAVNKNNKIVARQWYKGIKDTMSVEMRCLLASAFVIDADHIIPDINRGDNYYNPNSNFLPATPPLCLKFLGGLDNSQRTNIYIAPAVGYNVYDGGMLGILLHNGTLPLKNFEWSLAPMYSFKQKQINGVADADYSFFSGKNKITFGAGWKKFSNYESRQGFSNTLYNNDYNRLSFNASIDLNSKSAITALNHKISFRHLILNENFWGTLPTDGVYRATLTSNISELSYIGSKKNALGNTSWKLSAEYQSYLDLNQTRQQYLRPTLEVKHNFVYQQGKSIFARLFAGAMLFQTGSQNSYLFNNARGSLGLVQHGFNDYKYDDYYIGRNEQNGIWAHQINPNVEGGMKFLLPSGNSTALGFSNDFIFSVNIKADLPISLPKGFNIRPYFDFGYFSDNRNASIKNNMTWISSGGLSWEVGDVVGIYVPLFYSGGTCADDPNGLNCLMQQRTNFLDKVVFNINLKGLSEILKNPF